MSKTKKLTAMLLCVCLLLLFPASVLAETIQVQPIGGSPYFQTERQFDQYPEADGKYIQVDDRIYLDKNYFGMEEHTLFFDTAVGSYYPTDTAIYYVEKNGTSIKKLNTSTMESTVLFSGTAEIVEIEGDEEAMFFVHGNQLYRMHIPSKTAEFIITLSNMEDFITIGPRNTRYVHVFYNNPISVSSEVFRIDCQTGAVDALSLEQDMVYAQAQFVEKQQARFGDVSTMVLNTTNPYVNMLISPKISSLRSQYVGNTYTGTEDGSTQCVGFAKKVYKAIFGRYPATERWYHDIPGMETGGTGANYANHYYVALTTEFIKALPDGANVRVHGTVNTKNEDGSRGHTIVIVGRTPTTITVFESNWQETNTTPANRVTLTEMTFSEFKSRYDTITYFDHPSNRASHTHGTVLCYNYNASYHMNICNTCYDTEFLTHTYDTSTMVTEDGIDYYYCTGCWRKTEA